MRNLVKMSKNSEIINDPTVLQNSYVFHIMLKTGYERNILGLIICFALILLLIPNDTE